MGAHAVGELASKLAADSIPHVYSKHAQEGPVPALTRAFTEANQTIHTRGQQNKEFQGMGTTGTALVLREEGAWVGHVGDSRVYRIRAGVIEQLSFDHSLVWELARRQRRNPDELTGIPSNVIIRSLGPEPQVQVDVEGPHPVQPGDVYVLCSDGLSGPVHDREIGAVASTLEPADACRFLIHLANLQGGPDNITAVVVRVRGEAAPSVDAQSPRPWNLWAGSPLAPRIWAFLKPLPWAFIALGLGIALAALAIFLGANDQPGDFLAFVMSGLFLVSGLVGLMLQTFWEQSAGPAPVARRVAVYRQMACAIEAGLVDRLEQAITSLVQRLQANHWDFDEAAFKGHLQRGQDLKQAQDWTGAFREHGQAMLVLMDTVQAHRVKEEAFRPLWDKMPG
jgi:serine/threonine protein phosphatase PrpC